ncbi:MAG: GH43 family beta-xylosidase [Candidatus Endobugula sp.]|jgi:GH43 family beta-xylosidase
MNNIKQPILLSELSRFPVIDKVILESLEQALYRLVIEVDQQQYYVLEKKGKSLTRRSVVAIQELLTPFVIRGMYLSHQSPYDEMIGHEVNSSSNEMLVPIGDYFKNARDSTVH